MKLLIFTLLLTLSSISAFAQTVELNPKTVTLHVNQTAQASFVVKDAQGNVLPQPTAIAYLPDDALSTAFPRCATVSRTGVIKGVIPGQCTISLVVLTAGSYLLADPIQVTVLAGPAPTLLLQPNGRALALHSPNYTKEPFGKTTPPTRIMLFFASVDPTMTVTLIDSAGTVHPLTIEYVKPLEGVTGVTAVIVPLPANVALGEATIFGTSKGVETNRAKIAIGAPVAQARKEYWKYDPHAVLASALMSGARWEPIDSEWQKLQANTSYGEVRALRKTDVVPHIALDSHFTTVWNEPLNTTQWNGVPVEFMNAGPREVTGSRTNDKQAYVMWR